jgi:transketolase
MRAEFAREMISLADEYQNIVFLTGDLGYMALEKVRARLGERFINAGVAEQNMVSVAAGLAREGFVPWLYSIAPFAVLRPYEQIRNDVCLHNLPVKIVGNGGGYGYGIMGATHHALEDLGAMRILPNMKVYVPLFAKDVGEAVRTMMIDPSPNYLRLNLALPNTNTSPVESFRQWRKLKDGKRAIFIGIGPVVGNLLGIKDSTLQDDLEIWSIGILPLHGLPAELLQSAKKGKLVVTMEEHYGQCGINESVAQLLLEAGCGDITYKHLCATGYPSGTYGSQRWHQEQSGLAGGSLVSFVKEALYG